MDSQEFSPTLQFKSINSSVLSLLYGPTLTFVHDYWKNHSFDFADLCGGQENCISPSSRMVLWIKEVGSQGQFHKEEETGELGFEE